MSTSTVSAYSHTCDVFLQKRSPHAAPKDWEAQSGIAWRAEELPTDFKWDEEELEEGCKTPMIQKALDIIMLPPFEGRVGVDELGEKGVAKERVNERETGADVTVRENKRGVRINTSSLDTGMYRQGSKHRMRINLQKFERELEAPKDDIKDAAAKYLRLVRKDLVFNVVPPDVHLIPAAEMVLSIKGKLPLPRKRRNQQESTNTSMQYGRVCGYGGMVLRQAVTQKTRLHELNKLQERHSQPAVGARTRIINVSTASPLGSLLAPGVLPNYCGRVIPAWELAPGAPLRARQPILMFLLVLTKATFLYFSTKTIRMIQLWFLIMTGLPRGTWYVTQCALLGGTEVFVSAISRKAQRQAQQEAHTEQLFCIIRRLIPSPIRYFIPRKLQQILWGDNDM